MNNRNRRLYKITVIGNKRGFQILVDQHDCSIDRDGTIHYKDEKYDYSFYIYRLDKLMNEYVNMTNPKLEMYTFDPSKIDHHVLYMKRYIKSELIHQSMILNDLINDLDIEEDRI